MPLLTHHAWRAVSRRGDHETKKDADARRIVELPAGGDLNYRYMLRAADHQKPLIVARRGSTRLSKIKLKR